MNTRATILALATLLLSSTRVARADEFYQHAVLNCSAKTTWAVVTTAYSYNDDPAPQGVDHCVVPGLGPVKLRVNEGPVYAYGQGYGIPTLYVSLWVKQAKVISNVDFKCDGSVEGDCGLRIELSRGGLRVCRRSLTEPDSKPDCSFTAWSDVPMQRDTLEYPSPGERKRPRTNSMQILYASDSKFCESFIPNDKVEDVWLPDGATVVEGGHSTPWEYAGHYDRYNLDVNNDGTAERIVHLHAETHADDGDTMFVFAKKPVPEVVVDRDAKEPSNEQYAKAADWVLLNEQQIQKVEVPAPWWDPADRLSTLTFGSYTYLKPIRLRDRTYLIVTTPVANLRHWTTVLEPMPDNTVALKCAFQRVQPNL